MATGTSATNAGTATTPSVAVPASTAINDIMVLACSCDDAAVVWATKYPAGFVSLGDVAITADGQRASVGWKRLTGADSGTYTFSTIGGGEEWLVHAIRFTGRDTTNPPVASTAVVNNVHNTSPVTVSANGVTSVTGDDLLWVSIPDASVTGATNGHTPPAGYAEQTDTKNLFEAMSLATSDNVAAGATGTVSGTLALTSGFAGYAAFLVRIPAAAGTTVSDPFPAASARAFRPLILR